MSEKLYSIDQVIDAVLDSREEIAAVIESECASIMLRAILEDNLESCREEAV